MQMFQIAINMLFEKLFARVHASHCGCLGLIPGRDMSVSGPLVENGDDLGHWSSLSMYSGDPDVIILA
jgi:hypothetical protein